MVRLWKRQFVEETGKTNGIVGDFLYFCNFQKSKLLFKEKPYMKSDIEIARSIELKKIKQVAESVGIPREEVENYGRYIA